MEGIAVGVVLAISLLVVPSAAQIRPDPGPEEPRTSQRIRMMRDMRADTEMLERPQRELQQSCSRLAPKDPKAGG